MGFKDRAIIYVSDGAKPNRKRFSTGHELGHWHHHRGQSFVCRSDDIGRPLDERSRNAERMADVYSADLILPPYRTHQTKASGDQRDFARCDNRTFSRFQGQPGRHRHPRHADDTRAFDLDRTGSSRHEVAMAEHHGRRLEGSR
ncbi:ImmA/IrrE family metallo-endopeptidase [Bradyrhizobium huanghuaihaiense]